MWPFMPAMGEIPMAGGWSLSAMWVPMCGQSLLSATVGFTAMWSVMMVPMMLPALLPTVVRYLRLLARNGIAPKRASVLAALACLAWALAWAAFGVPVFGIGAAVAHALVQDSTLARLAPTMSAATAVAAAGWHVGSWRMRHRCRQLHPIAPATVGSALRHGLRMGRHCIGNCAGLTVALLAIGAMDWRVMACGAVAVLADQLPAASAR